VLYRQGDVFIQRVEKAGPPSGRINSRRDVIVRGTATGHSHRVADPETAILWEDDSGMVLRVTAPQARIVHEEHGPIELPSGDYRVWIQREYVPQARPPRRVCD